MSLVAQPQMALIAYPPVALASGCSGPFSCPTPQTLARRGLGALERERAGHVHTEHRRRGLGLGTPDVADVEAYSHHVPCAATC